jgi:hypothetical protein
MVFSQTGIGPLVSFLDLEYMIACAPYQGIGTSLGYITISNLSTSRRTMSSLIRAYRCVVTMDEWPSIC